MSRIVLATVLGCSMLSLGACTTKVVNQPPAQTNTVVREVERPVPVPVRDRDKPDIQTNVHVDR